MQELAHKPLTSALLLLAGGSLLRLYVAYHLLKLLLAQFLFLISHRIRLGFLTACEIIHKALYQID